MKKYSITALLSTLVALVLINSCKTDLEHLGPYVETIAVNGLLSQDEDTNFIKITRVFLGEGDATQMAQIKDSVYFKPGELSVWVEKIYKDKHITDYVFHEGYTTTKDGAFNPEQLLYFSTQKLKVDSGLTSFTYKLHVRINKTGKEFTAETQLVKNLTKGNACSGLTFNLGCIFSETKYNIGNKNQSSTFRFAMPENARISNVLYRFFYTEYDVNNTALRIDSVDFRLPTQILPQIENLTDMTYVFASNTWFEAVGAGASTSDLNVDYRIADSLQIHFYLGEKQLADYISVQNVSGSFGQEKPVYTNISNGGIGIFSSRSHKVLTKKFYNCNADAYADDNLGQVVSSDVLARLAVDAATCKLRFKKCIGGSTLGYTNASCE